MNRGKEPLVSLCERKFVLDAIKESKRLDGRGVYDYRSLQVIPGSQPGNVEVLLGKTRVLANVSCEVVRPRPERPTDGELFFNVELSPMASPGFEVGRPSPVATEVARMLERCLKESRAVDTESLCIIAGEKVWSIRVDLHVLDYCGNIIDGATIAAITALKHFRRPDVTVIGEEATIHPVTEREPVPLSVHHMPFCISFALFSDGEYLLVDPSLVEEVVMEGRLVVGMNVHREICVLGMAGGVSVLPDQLLRCSQIAAVKCQEITEAVKTALTGTTPNRKTTSIMESKRDVRMIGGGEEEKGGGVEVDKGGGECSGEEDEVMYLGEGTAEVGLGGRSQWRVDGDGGNMEGEDTADSHDVIVIDSGDDVKGECGEGVEVGGGSSSEEEAVIILTEQDVGRFSKRGGRKGRGKRGGGTAPPHTPTPKPVVPETAGRGTKRKKRRKKQT